MLGPVYPTGGACPSTVSEGQTFFPVLAYSFKLNPRGRGRAQSRNGTKRSQVQWTTLLVDARVFIPGGDDIRNPNFPDMMPWDEWGESSTRWIYTGKHALSKAVLCGNRFFTSTDLYHGWDSDESMDSTTADKNLVILDFNLSGHAPETLGTEAEGRWSKAVSQEMRSLVHEPGAFIKFGGPEDSGYASGLPYIEVLSQTVLVPGSGDGVAPLLATNELYVTENVSRFRHSALSLRY